MAIASFASKIFSVSSKKIYTFTDFSHNSDLRIEEQEVEGQKPSTYIKGSGLDDINLTVPLIFQDSINVDDEVKDWCNLKDNSIPYMLIIGTTPVGNNKFLLVKVSESETTFDNNGKRLKTKLTLQFQEFVRYGSSSDNPETSAESKSTQKRSNPNAIEAKSQGYKSMEALEQELWGE